VKREEELITCAAIDDVHVAHYIFMNTNHITAQPNSLTNF